MARNGRRSPRRPRIEMRQSGATPEEAAAIAAAIEQFLRDTAPAPASPIDGTTGWARSATLAAARIGEEPDPWGDPEPWGRGAP